MSFRDPSDVLLGRCLSTFSHEHRVCGNIEVHVTSCADSCDQFEDAAQERITRTRPRLERDLLPCDICAVEEPQIRTSDPVKLRIARQIFAQEKFFYRRKIQNWSLRSRSHLASLCADVSRIGCDKAVGEEHELCRVFCSRLHGRVAGQLASLITRQDDIIFKQVIDSPVEPFWTSHRDIRGPFLSDFMEIWRASLLLLSRLQGSVACLPELRAD